jgi:hypothetical protein
LDLLRGDRYFFFAFLAAGFFAAAFFAGFFALAAAMLVVLQL